MDAIFYVNRTGVQGEFLPHVHADQTWAPCRTKGGGTATETSGTLAVQDDGNVVIYDGSQAIWWSGTAH
ncbi:hypothetical protein ABZ769_24985 [Streptomyces olivoreticuli]